MRVPVLAVASLLAAAALAASGRAAVRPVPAPAAPTLTADPVHSFVGFRIRHMGASWTYGRFNEIAATLGAGEGGAILSSVEFTVKAASVDTGNAKRDQHLRSPDFLNAVEFPDISFRSASVKAAGPDAVEVTGDLTLHGVTRPLTAKVSRVGSGRMGPKELTGFEASFTVKRGEFGMDKSVGEGGDEVLVTVAVEASPK